MPIEITVPALGEGVESGDVLEILVKVGDTIKANDGVVELETDKATVTIPATSAGKVTKILVSTGATVKVGQALVAIEAVAGAEATPKAPPTPPAAKAPFADSSKSSASAPKPVSSPKPTSRQSVPSLPTVPADVTIPSTPTVPSVPSAPVAPSKTLAASGSKPAVEVGGGDHSTIAAGPAIRRFAREVGVDLHGVKGSGNFGRVTRDDVLRVVRSGAAKVANGQGSETNAGGQSDSWGPIRLEKLTKIRTTIANKMHESWSTVPRVTNFDDADITELEHIRQGNKKDYEAQNIKLTTLPFLIKAVAMSLKSHPIINASIDLTSNQIIYKEYVNVGIAVDTERGLVVPSLRNADKLGIPDIARSISEISETVRTGKFSVDDLRGSSFTISNLGAIGGTYSTPIINIPETAILLVGRARKMPVVVDDKIVVRLMMPLSLSYDHRLIDGGAAARFLNDVIAYLEAPSRLLLAL